MNDFDSYQQAARKTAIYPEHLRGIYTVLGLCGEAGEVAEKVKKLHRDGKYNTTEFYEASTFRDAIKKELGDVLWYLANTAADYGLDLSDVAASNLEKLADRKARGTLQGSGDQR